MSGTTLRCPAVPAAASLARNGGKAETPRVLILGGTGRVGGSTATALSKLRPDLLISIAGRNREKGAALVSTLGENLEFVEVDIDNTNMLHAALEGVDLVVHAAGPFQQEEKCSVLEAAISTKTAYIDVCDDTNYSRRAKSFHEKAVASGIPAITTCGIYPGVSNVMAAELVRNARSEKTGEPERIRFFYYTAGSGGAGPTILATSFLLLGEEVIAYNKGEKVTLKPYSGMLNIDFGKGVGKKNVYLLNLPEVRSVHEVLGVPSVSARFGTAPFFWNWGMEAMVNLVPADILRDKSKVRELVQLFDPLVRAVDGFAGERVSMRVDLECSNGRKTLGLFTHRRLSVIRAWAGRLALVLGFVLGHDSWHWFLTENSRSSGLLICSFRCYSCVSSFCSNFVYNHYRAVASPLMTYVEYQTSVAHKVRCFGSCYLWSKFLCCLQND